MKELWETNEGIKLSRCRKEGMGGRGCSFIIVCFIKKMCCREVGDKIVLPRGGDNICIFLDVPLFAQICCS